MTGTSAEDSGRALPPGYQLHWYEIQSVLGQGGFGITYLARDTNLDKDVAIKEYLPQQFAQRLQDSRVAAFTNDNKELYQWGLDRFISEARTLSRFDHPNIVRVHTVFEENGTGYMVMSYEQGEGLQEILKRRGTLDEATLLGILCPLLTGLDLVHQQNFIHRDIKPDNIYIRRDGSPVLLDFGSARQAVNDQPQAMTVMVSPGYAPFEQYSSNSDDQGPWTDVYGLGATSYKAITGRPLTNAVDRSKTERGGGECPEAATLLQSNGTYSEALLRAVNHAIAFEPEDRPQTARAWLAELPSATQSGETVVMNVRPASRHSAVKTSSRRGAYLAFAGVLLAAVAGAAYYMKHKDTKPALAAAETRIATQSAVTGSEEQESKLQAEENQQAAGVPDEEPGMAESTRTVSSQAPSAAPGVSANVAQRTAAQQELEDAAHRQSELLAMQQQEDRLERERLARQKLEDDRRAIEVEKAALAKAREDMQAQQQRQAREAAIDRKIQASETEFASRGADKPDDFAYDSNGNPQPIGNFAGAKLSLEAFANASRWQGTGLAIERGRTYRITASGQWQMGGLCKPSDATGKGMYAMLCLDLGGQTVVGHAHGALIGKINRDSLAFYIGPEFTFTAGESGELFLMSNDAPAYIKDNTGSLSVTVTELVEPAGSMK